MAAGDPRGFGRLLEEFPNHCLEGLLLGERFAPLDRSVRAVVVAGMGGSAVGGDLLSSVLGRSLTVPLQVVRGYDLPPWVASDSLVVAVSYSGNTEETLSVFRQAVKAGAQLAAVTSGGVLLEEAAARGIPHASVPKGLPPRSALGYLFFSLLQLAARAGVGSVPAGEIEEALASVRNRLRSVGPTVPTERNLPKRLAQALVGKILVVYGSAGLNESVAYRWKTQIEENAKLFSVSGALPEADHNEVVGWDGDPSTGQCHAIFLRDRGEDARITRRMEVTREIAGRHAETTEVWSEGDGLLGRTLSLVQLGDWTSYYLALLRGVDPWPVEIIERMKARLAARG